MPVNPKIAALVALVWAGSAHANPAGAPPDLSSPPPSVTSPPPSVTSSPPGVTGAPPSVTPTVPSLFSTPRRCRIVERTDSFGVVRRVRRCR